MRLYCGTSGFSYDGWHGAFYPEDLPAEQRLPFYGARFDTVEINNTFYQMPKRPLMERWAAQVPDGFRFAVKSPKQITHIKKLKDCGDAVQFLVQAVAGLGARQGPLLFQLPPFLRKDAALLKDFVAALPVGCRAAFEFRHATWEDPEAETVLRDHGVALCLADMEDGATPALRSTATWGYLRLRRPEYTDQELAAWVERVRAQPWQEVFVFFKHEDAGLAPKLATRFREKFGLA
jgi:uncharacterized protein YecE (DUF72 family)